MTLNFPDLLFQKSASLLPLVFGMRVQHKKFFTGILVAPLTSNFLRGQQGFLKRYGLDLKFKFERAVFGKVVGMHLLFHFPSIIAIQH